MTLAELSSPEAVVAAMEEYDRLGREHFRKKYGLGAASEYLLVYEGRLYDPKAIAGGAHAHQFPGKAPLTPDEFQGGVGSSAVNPKLASLGFGIVRASDFGLTTAAARALVDIRDGNRPHDTPTGILGAALESWRPLGLISEQGDRVSLSPAGEETLSQILEEPQPQTAWLFQANPQLYDIAAAVHELSEINWTVAQRKNLIKTGDRVYIWQSGQEGASSR